MGSRKQKVTFGRAHCACSPALLVASGVATPHDAAAAAALLSTARNADCRMRRVQDHEGWMVLGILQNANLVKALCEGICKALCEVVRKALWEVLCTDRALCKVLCKALCEVLCTGHYVRYSVRHYVRYSVQGTVGCTHQSARDEPHTQGTRKQASQAA